MDEHELQASGTLRLFLVLNLSRFIHHSTPPQNSGSPNKMRNLFNHLRGSHGFLKALRNWKPQFPFERDLEQDQIEEEGYRLRVFRSRLRQTQFLPTFRLHWTPELCKALHEQDPSFAEEWKCWCIRLRFTPFGLAAVSLERKIERESLVQWTEHLLEIQRDRWLGERGQAAELQVQWWLSRWVLTHFLETVGWKLTVECEGNQETIHFQIPQEEDRPLRLDRYAIYHWESMTFKGNEIEPNDLKNDKMNSLVGVLEGSLIVEGDRRRYPLFSPNVTGLEDVSSWQDEMCLLTGEGAIIFTPLVRQGIALFSGSHFEAADAYANYWKAIVRGFEHLVAFRAEAERAQRRTVELLAMVPKLTQRVNDGNISLADEAAISALASGLSDIFDALPEQRSHSISAIFFRADYARKKFEFLMDRLNIHSILDQVDMNVEQLSYFLEYYNDMRLQWQSQRVNTLAWRVAVVVLFMATSSFLNDAFQVWDRWNQQIGVFSVRGWSYLTIGVLGCILSVWWIRDQIIRRGK